jgi:hypothetical protein
MLNRLCTADNRGVKDLLVFDLTGDVVRFFDNMASISRA